MEACFMPVLFLHIKFVASFQLFHMLAVWQNAFIISAVSLVFGNFEMIMLKRSQIQFGLLLTINRIEAG